jgi:hypothetical protein
LFLHKRREVNMSESIGWEDKLLWGLVCPKCKTTSDLSELGFKSIKVGEKIYHTCECGCKLVKLVGKDMGEEVR